uniref:NADH dehydrogenase subunit 3 n=1 Tax=Amblyomma patinoi TaxID=1408821 RepID=UPI0023F24CCF|nr:NADH dehydrogenase subunit 3 [Amblyomma patinoi]WEF75007.1 NADH dehydrogenase subunit 3 [Amblyomma patinoi]
MFLLVIPFVIFLLILMFLLLNFKSLKMKEKLSPFECGFDPFSLSRMPFSLKFFFLGIVFLVFDVEIIVILPFPILLMNKSFSLMFSFIMINLVILLGFLYEWKSGMIEWMK